MDYLEFEKQFEERRRKIKLPPDCTEGEPTLSAPGAFSWEVEWQIDFPDAKYLRLWEHHAKVKDLHDARREQFSYHYGPIVLNAAGVPDRDSDDPVHIRIDTSGGTVHLHYDNADHIAQDKIVGLDLQMLDMFSFLKAILKHRRTKKPIDKVLSFRVIR